MFQKHGVCSHFYFFLKEYTSGWALVDSLSLDVINVSILFHCFFLPHDMNDTITIIACMALIPVILSRTGCRW